MTLALCSSRSVNSHELADAQADLLISFSIDGVLVRGNKPLPTATKTLHTLQEREIPFLLLTNGGGYHEERRAEKLTEQLGVPIGPEQVLQSHTPFQDMHEFKDGTTLIVGGDYENAREVAHKYAYRYVPEDAYADMTMQIRFQEGCHTK